LIAIAEQRSSTAGSDELGHDRFRLEIDPIDLAFSG
jgi:hypothetical protein